MIFHFLCLTSLMVSLVPNISYANSDTPTIHHDHHSHHLLVPFIFPQLYSCIKTKDSIPAQNESKSQGREDFWLYEQIFSKLPIEELMGGTFLEIGALDGEKFSNSWFFEKKFDWRGILVEGHPLNQVQLRQNVDVERKRENVAVFSAAICAIKADSILDEIQFTTHAGPVGAAMNAASKKFLDYWHKGDSGNLNSTCIPMQSIIESTNLMDIDLFSLDVEGSELYVLNTINFARTNFRVIVVENDGSNKEKDEAVRKLLQNNGFINAESTYGNIRDVCPNPRGNGCPFNEVFINPLFQERSRKKLKSLYERGTSVRCQVKSS